MRFTRGELFPLAAGAAGAQVVNVDHLTEAAAARVTS